MSNDCVTYLRLSKRGGTGVWWKGFRSPTHPDKIIPLFQLPKWDWPEGEEDYDDEF